MNLICTHKDDLCRQMPTLNVSNMTTAKSRGQRLYQLRKEINGMTQHEAADKIGIPRTTLDGYEKKDDRFIDPGILEKMAQVYKTTVEFIKTGLDPRTNVTAAVVYNVTEQVKQLPEGIKQLIEDEKHRMKEEYEASIRHAQAAKRRAEAERDEVKSELDLVRLELERLRNEKGKGGK